MKVVILGNYILSNNQSMLRFEQSLESGLKDQGHQVKIIRPQVLLGRFGFANVALTKWLGGVDRFIIFPLWLRFHKVDADVVHIPDHGNAIYLSRFQKMANVVTCHDVQPYRSARGEIPHNKLGAFARVYQSWVLSWIMRAQYVACVSSNTLKEWLVLTDSKSNAKTVLVAPALTYPYCPMASGEAILRLRRLMGDVDAPYILHVGSNVWYKNRMGLARIYDSLVSHEQFSHARLVIAGRPLTSEVRKWLDQRGHTERLVEVGLIENEDLRALYSMAALFLFPSLFEGFGMPIIEAQACECLVATTRQSPMSDVGGAAAVLIDIHNADSASATIVEQWPNRKALIAEGVNNAKLYTRDAMTKSYLDIYRRAVEEKLGVASE